MEKIVSIIVPIYNCEAYLKNCIESLICQTYKEIEIILINDGSNDLSGKICERYQKKDKRIKYIYQKNKGASFARNNGLENMTGDYFTFVDSDDFVDKNYVKTMIDIIEKNNCDFVMCDFSFSDNYNIKKVKLKSTVINNMDKTFKKFLIDDFNISCWSKLYSSKSFRNIRFSENIKYTEDKLYIFDCLINTKKYAITNYVGYFYNSRNGSVSHSFNEKMIDDLLNVSNIFNDYAVKYYPSFKNIQLYLTTYYLFRNLHSFNVYDEYKKKYIYIYNSVFSKKANIFLIKSFSLELKIFLLKFSLNLCTMFYKLKHLR